MLPIKKRYIATALGAIFLFCYALILANGPRGSVARSLSPLSLSLLSRTGASERALDKWDAVHSERAEKGLDAESRAAVARMKRAVVESRGGVGGGKLRSGAASTGSSSSSSSSSVSLQGTRAAGVVGVTPGGEPPLNVILLAAPKLDEVDVVTCLTSIATHAPDAVVLLIVNPGQATALQALFKAPGGEGEGGSSSSTSTPPTGSTAQQSWRTRPTIPLLIRMYSWPALDALLTPTQRGYMPPIRRYAMYPLLLDDMEAGGAAASSTGTSASGEEGPILLFSNLPPALVRAPDGVFISDARDMVFQADPSPRFWGMRRAEGVGAGEAALVVAGEARVTTIGKDDWNRGWVSFCYYDLGEAMVGGEQIFCSGTTFGTLRGVRYYIAAGMLPAMGYCSVIDWEKGMDQGIHNVLLHRYTPEALDGWRAAADRGGPFRPGGGKEPIMARPREFLDFVQGFQAGIKLHVSHAEEGDICTMALLLTKGVFRDEQGRVLPSQGGPPCAVVHQFDRSPPLVDYFRQHFKAV